MSNKHKKYGFSYEQFSLGLAVLWCLLPLVMSLYGMINGYLGRFKPEISATGFQMSLRGLKTQIYTYHAGFMILGCLTGLFTLCVLLCYGKGIFKEITFKKHPLYHLLFCVFIWNVISLCVNYDGSTVFKGSEYVYEGIISCLIYACVFICGTLIRNDKYRMTLLGLFCGVTVYLAVIVIIQKTTGSSLLNVSFSPGLAAVFNNPAHFGCILSMACAGFMSLYIYEGNAVKKTIYLAGYLISLYALLQLNLFWVGLSLIPVAALIYVLYYKKNRFSSVSVIPALLLFLTCAVNIMSTPSSARLDTVGILKESLLFGNGSDSIGIPGVLLGCAAIYIILRKLFKDGDMVSLVLSALCTAYLFSSVLMSSAFNVRLYFWLFSGLTVSVSDCLLPNSAKIPEKLKKLWYWKYIAAVAGCFMMAVILFGISTMRYEEYVNEYSDMLAMHNANLAVQIAEKNGRLGDQAVFYYDARTFKLVSIDGEMPRAYGLGTESPGDASYDFISETGADYGYDERADYTGKIVRITITGDSFKTEWVPVS